MCPARTEEIRCVAVCHRQLRSSGCAACQAIASARAERSAPRSQTLWGARWCRTRASWQTSRPHSTYWIASSPRCSRACCCAPSSVRALRKENAELRNLSSEALVEQGSALVDVQEQANSLQTVLSSLQDVVVRQVKVRAPHHGNVVLCTHSAASAAPARKTCSRVSVKRAASGASLRPASYQVFQLFGDRRPMLHDGTDVSEACAGHGPAHQRPEQPGQAPGSTPAGSHHNRTGSRHAFRCSTCGEEPIH